jgi:hypothetical protein
MVEVESNLSSVKFCEKLYGLIVSFFHLGLAEYMQQVSERRKGITETLTIP